MFDVRMKSIGEYWISTFNILESETKVDSVFAHANYVKIVKGKITSKNDSK